jgi:hypothetical protein
MNSKIRLPWLLRALGVGKWLRERAFRLPEEALPVVSTLAAMRAESLARSRGKSAPEPADWWRAVEATQVSLVVDGAEIAP